MQVCPKLDGPPKMELETTLGVEDMAVTPSQAPSPDPGQELGRFEGEHSVTGSP